MSYKLVPQIPMNIYIFLKDVSFIVGEKYYSALALMLRKGDIFTAHSKPVVIICLQPHSKYRTSCFA